MTAGQARAVDELGRFCLEPATLDSLTKVLDLDATYGRPGPVGLEIGFGMGHALLDWAESAPDWNLLGLEIYQPGIGALLLGVERLGLENVRVMEAAAEVVLARQLPAGSLDEVRIFFPDPWPKKKHFKRRLIQSEFLSLVADRLRPGGCLWLATDWAGYAEWMAERLAAEPMLEPESPEAWDSGAASARVQTRFEARGLRLGHAIHDFRYRRVR